jgi:hypothetical protein
MKILMAILVNSFFSFLGFVLFLCLIPQGESSGGWIGGRMFSNFKDWLYLSAFLSIFACVPVGLVNGFILGSFKNNLLVAVLLAVGYSFTLTIFLLSNTHYLEDFPKMLIYVAIFFAVCCLCNIATVYLLKWKFPNSL